MPNVTNNRCSPRNSPLNSPKPVLQLSPLFLPPSPRSPLSSASLPANSNNCVKHSKQSCSSNNSPVTSRLSTDNNSELNKSVETKFNKLRLENGVESEPTTSSNSKCKDSNAVVFTFERNAKTSARAERWQRSQQQSQYSSVYNEAMPLNNRGSRNGNLHYNVLNRVSTNLYWGHSRGNNLVLDTTTSQTLMKIGVHGEFREKPQK